MDFLQDLEGDGLLGVFLVLALAVVRLALDFGAHDEDAIGRIAPLAADETELAHQSKLFVTTS